MLKVKCLDRNLGAEKTLLNPETNEESFRA